MLLVLKTIRREEGKRQGIYIVRKFKREREVSYGEEKEGRLLYY